MRRARILIKAWTSCTTDISQVSQPQPSPNSHPTRCLLAGTPALPPKRAACTRRKQHIFFACSTTLALSKCLYRCCTDLTNATHLHHTHRSMFLAPLLSTPPAPRRRCPTTPPPPAQLLLPFFSATALPPVSPFPSFPGVSGRPYRMCPRPSFSGSVFVAFGPPPPHSRGGP